jgi:P4 family phage/plasmid primase-like protien
VSMPDKQSGPPRDISPFRNACPLYQKAGWGGTLPLPAKEKHPPPTGFTGHKAPWPTKDNLLEWMNDPKRRRANIGLRLAGVDSECEVIGIDVDHYAKGGKEKRGGDQLEALENRFGKLPDTWISSARTDGVSGIRYFRVPRGLTFRGQVAKDIECINKGYRFAVVWPSIHPDGGIYWWFAPGSPLSDVGRKLWDARVLPDARSVPALPDKWLDYLTQGRMVATEDDIDMESTVDTVYAWADETLPVGEQMCYRMRQKMEKHVKLIQDEATSHDKITNAHMNVLHLAREGHTGWVAACNLIEQTFADECQKRDKRSLDELRGEIWRSRTNALRKTKGKIDAAVAMGVVGVPDRDMECDAGDAAGVPILGLVPGGANGDGSGGDISDVPRGPLIPTPEYLLNDDGNADHFVDMFSSIELGPAVRYVEGYGWIIWHNGDQTGREPHWELDTNGVMRRLWVLVRKRQEDYRDACKANFDNALNAAIAANLPTSGGNAPPALVIARAEYQKWEKFSLASGMNRNANAAIERVKEHNRVQLSLGILDASPSSLGVANGVIELNPDGAVLRRALATDYITLNTGVAWKDETEISTVGKKLWADYLDKFLPDADYRKDVQIALGHCLIGGNPHKKLFVFKGGTNTGKSVMISMINEVLGDYAATVNKSLFQYHKLNPVLAMALPKRVVSIIELSRDTKNALTIDQMKTATGNDVVQAELKGSNDPINRRPFFVPIIVTNTVPNVEGADKALRERLWVVDFEVVEENPDDTIAARMLMESREAVLAWLIEGYNMYCQIGRQIPENAQMKQAKIDFASEMDDVSEFAVECLETHSHMGNMSVRWQDTPQWCARPQAVHDRYELWFDQTKRSRRDFLSQSALTRRLNELGFIQKQIRPDGMKANRYWLGVKIKSGSSVMASITVTVEGPELQQ